MKPNNNLDARFAGKMTAAEIIFVGAYYLEGYSDSLEEDSIICQTVQQT